MFAIIVNYYVKAITCKLLIFVVNVHGHINFYFDNKPVVNSVTNYDLHLKNKHLSIFYHAFFESVDAGNICVFWIES